MRALRLSLTLLLIAAMPLQGMAAFPLLLPLCPMEHGATLEHRAMPAGTSMSKSVQSASMQHMDMKKMNMKQQMDCCPHDDSDAVTGSSCQSDQQCHSGQPALAMMVEMRLFVSHGQEEQPAELPFQPSPPAVAIWRPPSLV